MIILGKRTLNSSGVTFGIYGDTLDRSFQAQRPVVVGVDEAVGDCAEADHVDLVFVADDEVVCGQTSDELESSNLLEFYLAVCLQDHAEGIIKIEKFLLSFAHFFLPVCDGLGALFVNWFELHLNEAGEDLDSCVDFRL